MADGGNMSAQAVGRVYPGSDGDLLWRVERIQQANRHNRPPELAPTAVFIRAMKGRGRGGGFPAFGGAHSAASYLGALSGKREAFIKIIGRGGCGTARALKAQVAYVAREGAVEVHGASCYGMDVPMSPEEIEETIDAWETSWTSTPKHGSTMHMIVSFPEDTDPAAALKTGQEFADRAFGSGAYGDTWDHMCALHTDKAHPHVHVIINRHGMENGRLLQTYKSSALNLDHMRSLQVEIAAANGIEMTATSRLSRGILETQPSAREYRDAIRDGLDQLGSTRTGKAVEYAERMIAVHRAAYDNLALAFAGQNDGETARMLSDAGELLSKGEPIMATMGENAIRSFENLADARAAVMGALEKAETKLTFTKDPTAAAALERQLGDWKGRVAAYAPERADLAAHAEGRQTALYRSPALSAAQSRLEGLTGQGADVSRQTDRYEAAMAATRADGASLGLDGDKFAARYASGGPLEVATEAKWAADDLSKAMKHNGLDAKTATPEAQRQIGEEIDALHKRTDARFKALADDLGADYGKTETKGHAQAISEASAQLTSARLNPATGREELARAHASLGAAVKNALTADQMAKLKGGEHTVLGELGMAPNAASQAAKEFNRVDSVAKDHAQRQALDHQRRQLQELGKTMTRKGKDFDHGL